MANDRRLDLHAKLVGMLGTDNVYFDPPESVKIKYPCIIYTRRSGDSLYANDMPYRFTQSYDVTYIDRNPDSDTLLKIATGFPMVRYDRHYTADNLHHDTFVLYY